MYILTEAQLKKLLEANLKLNCFNNAGVDCWDGAEYALEEFQESLEMIPDMLAAYKKA